MKKKEEPYDLYFYVVNKMKSEAEEQARQEEYSEKLDMCNWYK